MPRRRVTQTEGSIGAGVMPAEADNLRAELTREPLRLATLAVRTWGLAGPNERDVTDRLRKRIDRELRLRFGRLEELTPDQMRQARGWCVQLDPELRSRAHTAMTRMTSAGAGGRGLAGEGANHDPLCHTLPPIVRTTLVATAAPTTSRT